MKGILFARTYAHLYEWVKRAFGINLSGLGWALDWIQHARVIDVDGHRFFLSPQVSRAYGVMVAGFWNEPETHLFLDAIRRSRQFWPTSPPPWLPMPSGEAARWKD